MSTIDAIGSTGLPMRLDGQGSLPSSGARGYHLSEPAGSKPASGHGFRFGDFLDVVNPLQHIPGVAEIYRTLTNDEISEDARKTGNALYGFLLGGPIGLGAMMAYNSLRDGGSDAAAVVPTGNQPVIDRSVETNLSAILGQKDGVSTGDVDAEPGAGDVIAPALELLGTQVATVGSGKPLDLVRFLEISPQGQSELATATQSERKSPLIDQFSHSSRADDLERLVVPDSNGLERISGHRANHLSLDVLKALQERHAARTVSQQS